jgi:hypothetical protein
MAEFNYRFSVIPAPAIIDKDLSATAFRVLCLLGRHTNDAGWCSRSQVKMARELGVGRATIYDGLEILYERGYVERRTNGRHSRPAPSEGEQPFSAHSYRVKLDRDELPARIKDAIGDEGRAAPAAGGAAEAAGGADRAAPLEGISSEGISSEPERESARAREEMPVAKFLKKWPTAAVDDHGKIIKYWQDLGGDEQHAALAGIDAFLARLKADGRKHIIAGWKYLEEKRWKLLEAEAPADHSHDVKTWSQEWWAVLFHRIATDQATGFMLRYAVERPHGALWTLDKATEEQTSRLIAYAANGPEMAAWRSWFADRHIRFPEWRERFSVFLPSPAPGALATPDDLNHFAKTG